MTLSQAQRRAWRRYGKAYHGGSRVDRLAERAALAGRIAEHALDGRVQLVVWQMDCDCASWTEGRVMPAIPRLVERAIDRVYDGAEGPVRWHIEWPHVRVARNARDHALEAFENGHPHRVSI